MVDAVGDALVELADGVVGDLAEVDHRVESLEIVQLDLADVLGEHRRPQVGAGVQPADPVEAAVEPDHVEAPPQQVIAEAHADVAVGPGQEHPRHPASEPRNPSSQLVPNGPMTAESVPVACFHLATGNGDKAVGRWGANMTGDMSPDAPHAENALSCATPPAPSRWPVPGSRSVRSRR